MNVTYREDSEIYVISTTNMSWIPTDPIKVVLIPNS